MKGTYQSLASTRHRPRKFGSPSPGHGHNWLNDTARDLNHQIHNHRLHQPSTAQRTQWHTEFISSPAQYRMSFSEFLRIKTRHWHQQRQQRNWTFGTGRFRGQRISHIIRHNIDYITWTLENQPKGKTAKQIINFINLNPGILNSVKRNK